MRTLLIIFLVSLSGLALADTIEPEHSQVNNNPIGILWEDITPGDETAKGFWRGGCGQVQFSSAGALNDTDAELLFSYFADVDPVSVNDEFAPDGLKFDSANKLVQGFRFGRGWAKVGYTSSGQLAGSHDVLMVPVPCGG